MKRVLLLALFLLGASAYHSLGGLAAGDRQSGQLRVLYLHYHNSSGEKGVTTFEYDGGKEPARALWQLLNGKRNSINFYTYDAQGRLIKKYREFSDKKTSTQIYRYDSQGRLAYENFQRSDHVNGEVRYVYDNTGRCVSAECKKMNGWFTGVIEYQYDSRGRKAGAEIKRDGRAAGRILYTYNDSGLIRKEEWDFKGKWSQTFTYQYDSYPPRPSLFYTSANVFINPNNGYLIERESYHYSGRGGGPSTYLYRGGKLVRKEYKRSDGLKTITHFFYDGQRRLVKSLRRYADGNSGIFTYTFNPRRQLVRRTFIMVDGKTAEERYRYDPKGRLSTGTWENYDAWLSGNLSFCHDSRGRLKEGTFTSTGSNKFGAEIRFTHDSFDNLTQILWKFSFGRSQTYTFHYRKKEK